MHLLTFLIPFQCGICGKKFLYSYNVVAHVRNVHEKARCRLEERKRPIKEEQVADDDENIEYVYEEI